MKIPASPRKNLIRRINPSIPGHLIQIRPRETRSWILQTSLCFDLQVSASRIGSAIDIGIKCRVSHIIFDTQVLNI